ncbi:MAG: formate C-acetyltransferase [Patescibacteria group bacterium]|jgi:formate C-acetyltransferase
MSTVKTPFKKGIWEKEINTRDFIFRNITPYNGDSSFLVGPSKKTQELWNKCKELLKKELDKGGVFSIDTNTISTITSHDAGYIADGLEVIVGLQTDAPLKRPIKPFGGWRVVKKACEENGYELDEGVVKICEQYRKTHNDGVFDVYTPKMRELRSCGILTGLPDNYSRGRIIGDYRRIALYGVDRLIEEKQKDKEKLDGDMTEEVIQLREEISEQIRALEMIKEMAKTYGFDVSKPATNAREAVQWTYFGYLAAIKEQDGAAMSLGNVSSFFDIYIEKDMAEGKLTEEEAQEIIDQFIIKLRLVRHLRMSEYNQLFAGDPTWVTECLAGVWKNGQHKVTKTTYRFLQTLYNLGPAPEPNLTVLWSDKLPKPFKDFCAQVSIDTSSIQYENDDLMCKVGNTDDYCIACCVSMMETGKEMQFFGARCNLAKALLMALNEGRDEMTGVMIVDGIKPIKDGVLDYEEVKKNYDKVLEQLAGLYVNTMNVIHYMHDKYYYERAQMALMDTNVHRNMAFGAAGLSVVADSLSAIKYAKVTPVRNEKGLTTNFKIEGDFPKYGNDNDIVDVMAHDVVNQFITNLRKHYIYRNATPTLSILTITSNVVYGKKTGATPDGRKAGEPFAPGANPMHGRDSSGAIASLNSVAKIDYQDARDGVSNTFSIVPRTLGAEEGEQKENLATMIDGYFGKKAHHLNVNVLNRETLERAMEHPEEYPQLTIRVSGYAVNFVKLSPEQQKEVIARTFHESM